MQLPRDPGRRGPRLGGHPGLWSAGSLPRARLGGQPSCWVPPLLCSLGRVLRGFPLLWLSLLCSSGPGVLTWLRKGQAGQFLGHLHIWVRVGGQSTPTPGEIRMFEDLWETVPRANPVSHSCPPHPHSCHPTPYPKPGLGHKHNQVWLSDVEIVRARVYLQDGNGARASGDPWDSVIHSKPCQFHEPQKLAINPSFSATRCPD